MPTEDAPLIINFGAPIRLFDQRDPSRWTDHGSFTTGAYDSHVLVGSTGPSGGLEVTLSILGVRLFVGRPIGDLKNRAVSLDEVCGGEGRRLTLELYDAPDWEARFTILDRVLRSRILAAKPPPDAVLWMWRRLVETGGRAPVGAIAGETGFSQKHVIARFQEEIGLSPKVLGRVLRFGRAIRLIRRGGGAGLAEIAQACGYYDQAHFARDFHAFAGVTPTALVRSQRPDVAGFPVDR